MHPSWEIKNLRKRVNKARKFPDNTCPASRHVQMMADGLARTGYPMLQEEPEHCAQSLYATVAALYEARTELARWHKSYAGWCVLMMDCGIKAFGTLDQAFKKLRSRNAASREQQPKGDSNVG